MVAFTAALRAEYDELYAWAEITRERQGLVASLVNRIFAPANLDQYARIEAATGVPAWAIGIVHTLEANCDFGCHLHNGDPLSARTRQVPAGRPPGEPPFTWVESAQDAVLMQGLHRWSDWSAAGVAFCLEAYNGWGYRLYHPTVKSPYLWGFTTIYSRGKYVADGSWSPTAVSQQAGGMALLRRMVDAGRVTLDPGAGPGETAVDAYPGAALRRGDSGPGVAAAQQRLAVLGCYPGPLDGAFGPRTQTAVRAFQQAQAAAGRAMAVDGVIGPATWAAPRCRHRVAERSSARVASDGSLLSLIDPRRRCRGPRSRRRAAPDGPGSGCGFEMLIGSQRDAKRRGHLGLGHSDPSPQLTQTLPQRPVEGLRAGVFRSSFWHSFWHYGCDWF